MAALIAATPSRQSGRITNVTSNKCRLIITWLANQAVNDISNANFAVTP